MKARVKATGKLLEKVIPIMSVDSKVVMFHEYGTENEYYYYEDLDFSNTIDWEQVRIDATIKLICALSEKMLGTGYSEKQIVKQAIGLTNTLVEELKREDNNNQNDIAVIFRKEKDGLWHTYSSYGTDLDHKTGIEFINCIDKTVNVLNKKEDKQLGID